MLEKKYRLRKRKEFGYMYKHGDYSSNKQITLVTIPTKLKTPKIGFSISKKVGHAYLRNLIKRRLRAIVRELRPKLSPKFNYIFIAKNEMAESSFEEMKKSVLDILKRSGKYTNDKNN